MNCIASYALFALLQNNLLIIDFVSIFVLFCSLFMLFTLYFVHKKLFGIIFTCLNMLSFFFVINFYVKNNVKILIFLCQNFKFFKSKSGCFTHIV